MKRIALILLISLFTLDSFGFNRVQFGLTFSPTINWYRVDEETSKNDGVRLGMSYGLLFDYNIAENFAFSTGMMLSHNGGKVQFGQVMVNDTLKDIRVNDLYRLQHIEFPITLKLKTNQIGYITYYGQFGGLAGFRVRARADRSSSNDSVIEEFENRDVRNPDSDHVIKGINFFDLNLLVGGGIEYALSGSTSLVAGVYYSNGFINMVRERNSDEKITQNQVGIRLGVVF